MLSLTTQPLSEYLLPNSNHVTLMINQIWINFIAYVSRQLSDSSDGRPGLSMDVVWQKPKMLKSREFGAS